MKHQFTFDGDLSFAALGLSVIGLVITMVAAWVTHVVWVIGKIAGTDPVSGGEMAIGVLGAFMPPIGAIHGVVLWFS